MHGSHLNRHATIEADEKKIMARMEEKWLSIERDDAIVTWTRENGDKGRFVITVAGRLRTENAEEEMDMAAEAWARELMR